MLLVSSAGILTLRAQSAGDVPPTMTLLGRVIAEVEQIVTILNEQVVPAVTPQPGHVKLSTAAASVRAGDLAWCALSNVGETELGPITRRLVQADGTIFATGLSPSVPAGRTSAGGAGGPAFFGRCEFEFDGLAADVRANMFIQAPDGSTVAVLDAR